MAEAITIAIIAAGATLLAGLLTLAGVFAGALMEPFKLRAMAKATARQARADRCAKLIEAAQVVRDTMSDLVYMVESARVRGETPDLGTPRAAEIKNRAFSAFGELRTPAALLALSGPDDLATAADGLVDAARRYAQPGGQLDSESFALARASFDEAIGAFVVVARKWSG